MDRIELIQQIIEKRSFLCVGLDPDLERIPQEFHEMEDPIFEFNKMVIEETKDLCVAYKPNLAFYEQHGSSGWESLQRTVECIPREHFVIADAKRGDIGNTSLYYAKTFYENLGVDAVTLNPYMGHDSVTPYLSYKGKWAIVLALTSNEGAMDFQFLRLNLSDQQLYQRVIEKASSWGSFENMMFVVGATRGNLLQKVRELVPDHFFLVPGVGAQGGNLEEVAEFGMNKECGILVNMARSIIYAGEPGAHREGIRGAAEETQSKMEGLLKKFDILSD